VAPFAAYPRVADLPSQVSKTDRYLAYYPDSKGVDVNLVGLSGIKRQGKQPTKMPLRTLTPPTKAARHLAPATKCHASERCVLPLGQEREVCYGITPFPKKQAHMLLFVHDTAFVLGSQTTSLLVIHTSLFPGEALTSSLLYQAILPFPGGAGKLIPARSWQLCPPGTTAHLVRGGAIVFCQFVIAPMLNQL
jgi:hypothetical protein